MLPISSMAYVTENDGTLYNQHCFSLLQFSRKGQKLCGKNSHEVEIELIIQFGSCKDVTIFRKWDGLFHKILGDIKICQHSRVIKFN